jgi:hypothetical protein
MQCILYIKDVHFFTLFFSAVRFQVAKILFSQSTSILYQGHRYGPYVVRLCVVCPCHAYLLYGCEAIRWSIKQTVHIVSRRCSMFLVVGSLSIVANVLCFTRGDIGNADMTHKSHLRAQLAAFHWLSKTQANLCEDDEDCASRSTFSVHIVPTQTFF